MNDLTLKSVYANQFGVGPDRTDWNIITKEQIKIGEWPKSLNEQEFFHVLDFARKYELEAYEKGVADEKMRTSAYLHEFKRRYDLLVRDLSDANERLAAKLADLIGEGE
jgi:hypothetical protein